jgi:hypothetical protein
VGNITKKESEMKNEKTPMYAAVTEYNGSNYFISPFYSTVQKVIDFTTKNKFYFDSINTFTNHQELNNPYGYGE